MISHFTLLFVWEECHSGEDCPHVIHLEGSPEELSSAPLSWVKTLFPSCSFGSDAFRWEDERYRLHRDDGPAVEYDEGITMWYRHGNLHRVDGPAVIELNGAKEWWRDGKIHRDDGPAIIHTDGSVEWWLNGFECRWLEVDGVPDLVYSTDFGFLSSYSVRNYGA